MSTLAAPDSADPRLGRVVGQHLLHRVIARGATSVVYEAEHEVTRRRVAIKLVEASAPEEARRRMAREALIMARLTHRHIVRVENVVEGEDGSLLLVQELLAGPSLAEVIAERGFLPIEEALRIFTAVLDALAHAHEHGIVHRDVKPSNIVLARTPADAALPVLIDFGIAERLDRVGRPGADPEGAILGTPPYMALEQVIDPTRVDARADVWGCAMSLYETLTGAFPLSSGSLSEFVRDAFDFDPSRDSFLPGAPTALREAMARALQVPRDERTATALDLAQELEVALAASREDAERPTRAPPPSTPLATSPDPPARVDGGALSLALILSARDVDPVAVQDSLRELFGSGASVIRMRSYAELVEALESGEADLAWLPPVACARAMARGAGRIVAALQRSSGSGYRCALLGGADVRGYADLEGRRAVWIDRWSAAGYLVPRAMMRRHGIDPDRALLSQTLVESYGGVIDALAAGTADVGGTYCPYDLSALVLPEPLTRAGVAVLDVSDPIPPDTWCASPRMPVMELEALTELLLHTEAGVTIASAFGARRFGAPDAAAYEALVRALT